MFNARFMLQPVAVAALVLAAGASHAALTPFATLAAFNAGTVQQGTDSFNGFSNTGSTAGPVTRTTQSGTTYSYVANTTPSSLFFGGGTTANPFLSTNTATDSIVLNGFSPAIRAIGGNFFASDVTGTFATGAVTVSVVDSLGATASITLNATSESIGSFAGWRTNGTITSLTVTSVQPTTGFVWPSADNVVVAIPEPSTYALLLAGLGFVGFMARRKRG